MARVHYYYVPSTGWLAALEEESIEEQVKKAVTEANEAKRNVGIIELSGFAILAFTSAFGITMAVLRAQRRNPLDDPYYE